MHGGEGKAGGERQDGQRDEKASNTHEYVAGKGEGSGTV
jgi:hypothetical protein